MGLLQPQVLTHTCIPVELDTAPHTHQPKSHSHLISLCPRKKVSLRAWGNAFSDRDSSSEGIGVALTSGPAGWSL